MAESSKSRTHKEQMESIKNISENEVLDANYLVTKPTSLGSLVAWNIDKALEKNPSLDIKDAITSAQSRLEQVSDVQDINLIMKQNPYERYLACAMLAWQQLGHSDAESLCRFIDNKKQEEDSKSKLKKHTIRQEVPVSQTSSPIQRNPDFLKAVESLSFNSYAMLKMGPVIKLPVEPKIVMHMGGTCSSKPAKIPKAPEKDILNKINQACCLDTECVAKLAELDAATQDLRTRAGLLARREAERVELLERAETAWRDLELGYHRRLTLAEEKEDDLSRQIAKVIDERNKYKDACKALAQTLRMKAEAAESDRTRLTILEKDVCERACKRLQLSEQCTKSNNAVTELSCRVAQLDRDLQLQEEQARRRAQNLESETESARMLTLEAERALRAELGALRDQIADVSKQLLEEEATNENIKIYLDDLRQEKMDMIEDLEGCKVMCDGRMQAKVDQLKNAKDKLEGLKEKVIECRCKVPVDASVEVKRTPSLAALCKCTPEEKILETCSCTSMRTKLLSDLLRDLFAGLQSELGASVVQMPCQLLKCLEDKHNWDRASVVKNNLKDYFSQMLVGELDIAIATSIEKYHAKWVGQSCADVAKIEPDPGELVDEGWQERVIEDRAQKLATQLAEQLFQERADQLTERAKEIVAKGPPPCECKPETKEPAVYPCLVKNRTVLNMARRPTPVYWHQAMQDVTHLRLQLDHLKKDSLKKEDLKTMEDKFNKIIQRSSAKSCCPQERGEELERRTQKKSHNKLDGDDAISNQAASPILVKSKQTPTVGGGHTKSNDWHQTVQGVTHLRQQVEELKKDSLKKEDLKIMEKKLAKIIQRASGFIGHSNAHTHKIYSGSYNELKEETKKEHKKKSVNKIVNQSGLHSFDFNKPTCNKRSNLNACSRHKSGIKPNRINNHKVEKSYKNVRHTYAVNMCLCSTKNQQKISNEKCKLETWKQHASKDTESQKPGYKQSNPINSSLFSEDLTIETNSKEFDEQSCPSDCVCFHKKPSSSSIDKLLDTLAKWKCDLDTSIIHNKNTPRSSYCNDEKSDGRINLTNKQSLKDENINSKSNVKSRETSQERPMVEVNDCLSEHNSKYTPELEKSSESKSSKNSAKISNKSNHIGTTESEYIGAINLDKSNEEFCKCLNRTKNKKTIPFKCITSSKCNCEKFSELTKHGTRKEKDTDIATAAEIHQRPVKDVTVLTVSKSKEKSHSLQTPTKNILYEEKPNQKMFDPSDYQINFLGVTLTDVNTAQKSKTSVENIENQYRKKNICMKNVPCKEYEIEKRKTSKKSSQNKIYSDNSDSKKVAIKYLKLSDKVQNTAENIFNDENKSCPIDINYGTKTEEVNKSHERNKECRNENVCKDMKYMINNQTLFSQNLDESNVLCTIQNLNQHENSEFSLRKASFNDCKTSGNSQIQKCSTNTKIGINNYERTLSKKSPSPLINSFSNKNIHQSRLACKDVNIKSEQQNFLCECSLKFDEFKNYIKSNFIQQKTNEDEALDIPSLIDFKARDENCVCCTKFNRDDSTNLEENAFHLLEEYLRKKLDDFKNLSCSSSCIPPEEEEKLFIIILQRVKQLIIESTNKITCKCCFEGEKSHGSWNRAYGLLQEYLKMKIKKVQCTCVLAEDNNDTILPEVLDKISNLIEYDFQRLKDVCGCKNDPNIPAKIASFEAELPEKDTNIVLLDNAKTSVELKTIDNNFDNCNVHLTSNIKQSLSSQLPLNFEIDIQSPNSSKRENDLPEGLKINQFLRNDDCNCSKKKIDVNFVATKCNTFVVNESGETEPKQSFIYLNTVESQEKNHDKISTEHDIITNKMDRMFNRVSNNIKSIPKVIDKELGRSYSETNLKNFRYTTGNRHIDSIHFNDDNLKTNNEMASNVINGYEKNQKYDLEQRNDFVVNNSVKKSILTHQNDNLKAQKKEIPDSSNISKNLQLNMPSKKKLTTQESVKDTLQNIDNSAIDVPYIGYTIDCSCSDSLRPGTCPKFISMSNTDTINKIIRNHMPDKSYFEKVSYIMKSHAMENTCLKAELPEPSEDIQLRSILKKKAAENSPLHECETAISRTDEQFMLKKSKENIEMNHMTTNTFDDNTSCIFTEYSTNEENIDWCECSSQYNSITHLDSERLKKSLFFPTPLGDIDEQLKNYSILSQSSADLHYKITKHDCNCEMVPICQVKLLIENIETKLAKASCTCDSMIPKVCPVHNSQ